MLSIPMYWLKQKTKIMLTYLSVCFFLQQINELLILCLLVSSADNICKQFEYRSGPTKCWAWSESKVFETGSFQQMTRKRMQKNPSMKELKKIVKKSNFRCIDLIFSPQLCSIWTSAWQTKWSVCLDKTLINLSTQPISSTLSLSALCS